MKKLLLIPTLLTVASTPLFSLASCGNKYKVTNEEMLNAISFKDIDYLQIETSTVKRNEDGQVSYKLKRKLEMSPTVYHSIIEEDDGWGLDYTEKYVIKNDNNYEEFSRKVPDDDTAWIYLTSVPSDEFKLATEIGTQMMEIYTMVSLCGQTWTFDDAKKCYWSKLLYDDGHKCDISFYFENKKLIKTEKSDKTSDADSQASYTFTYNELTPTPPAKPGI